MKNIISESQISMLLLTIFCGLTAYAQIQANFTGTWKINMEKSDFNGAPTFTASKQFKINQQKDSVKIERLNLKSDNTETSVKETLTLTGKTTYLLSNKSTKSANISWSANEQELTINATYSMPDHPEQLEHGALEKWSLSDNGKTLTVTRKTESASMNYTVKAVYDKQ